MEPDPSDRPSDGECGVVGPEDLDFTRDRRVEEIRDGQYVIATDSSGMPVDPADLRGGESTPDRSDADATAGDDAERRVRKSSARFGFVITATIDGRITRKESFSDDLTGVFRDLVAWYAAEVGRDTPTNQVLGILLLSSGLQVRYPDRVVADLLETHDLTPADSIGDLLSALGDDGLRLPAERRD